MAYRRIVLEALEGEMEKLRVSLVERYGSKLGNALFYYLRDAIRVFSEPDLGKPNPTRRDFARVLAEARDGDNREKDLAEEALLEAIECLHNPHLAFVHYHDHDL